MEKRIFHSMEELDGIKLSYYIIIQNLSGVDGNIKGYGVRIEKIDTRKNGNEVFEAEQIDNIFFKKSDVDEFINLISRNKVTPISLRDITEDYVTALLLDE